MKPAPHFRLLTLHPVGILGDARLAAELKAEGYDVIFVSSDHQTWDLFCLAARGLFRGPQRVHWIGTAKPWVLSVLPFFIASWTQVENNGVQELDRRLAILAERDLQQGTSTGAASTTPGVQNEHADFQQRQTAKSPSEFDRLLAPSDP